MPNQHTHGYLKWGAVLTLLVATATVANLRGQDVARLLLTGKSYVWKWRNGMGGVTELWPLPTHWVKNKSLGTINPDPASGDTRRTISHFQVRVPGGVGGSVKKYDVPVEDMVYRRFFDPHSLTGGSSTFTAAYRPYKLDMERGDYMIELLKNMYSPGPVLYQDEEPGRPQMDEMRAALRDKIGPGKRGSPLFLWGKNARVDMIAPLKDLDWAGFAAMNESQYALRLVHHRCLCMHALLRRTARSQRRTCPRRPWYSTKTRWPHCGSTARRRGRGG